MKHERELHHGNLVNYKNEEELHHDKILNYKSNRASGNAGANIFVAHGAFDQKHSIVPVGCRHLRSI